MMPTFGLGYYGSIATLGFGAIPAIKAAVPIGHGGGGTYNRANPQEIIFLGIPDDVFSAKSKKVKKKIKEFELSIDNEDLDVDQKDQYEQMTVSSQFEKEDVIAKILMMQNQINFDMEKFFFYKSKYESSEEMKEKYERLLKKLKVEILFYRKRLDRYRQEFMEQKTMIKELNRIVEMQKQQIQTSAPAPSVPLIMFLCTTFGIAIGAGLAMGAGLLAAQILSGMPSPPPPPPPPPPQANNKLLMF